PRDKLQECHSPMRSVPLPNRVRDMKTLCPSVDPSSTERRSSMKINSLATSNPRMGASVLLTLCFGLILLSLGGSSQAANFGTKTTQGQVNTWASIWTNPPDTTVTAPVAGNTYEAHFNGTAFGATATSGSLNNTRVR